MNSTGDTVIYYYDAMGTKLRQTTIEANTVDRYYFNSFEYNDTLALDIIHNEEGYVSKSTEDYQYNYYLRDHLGNVRVVFTPVSTRAEKLIQATDYYPFGMKYRTQVNVSGENKYLFNGKELQDELNINLYDFETRHYDPVIGRFMTQDPMGESMNAWSPYSFTFDNPIKFNDPTGMVPDEFEVYQNGDIKQIETDSEDIVVIMDENGERTNETYIIGEDDSANLKEIQNTEGETYQVLEINYQNLAKEAFKGIANNSSVEFGLINYEDSNGDNNSAITTKGDEGAVAVSSVAKALYDVGGSAVNEIIHSHPNSTMPSGYDKSTGKVKSGSPKGDAAGAAQYPTNSKGQTIKRGVYRPAFGIINYYDKNNVQSAKKY